MSAEGLSRTLSRQPGVVAHLESEKKRLEEESGEKKRREEEAAAAEDAAEEQATRERVLEAEGAGRQQTISDRPETLAGARKRKRSRTSTLISNAGAPQGSISRRTLLGF